MANTLGPTHPSQSQPARPERQAPDGQAGSGHGHFQGPQGRKSAESAQPKAPPGTPIAPLTRGKAQGTKSPHATEASPSGYDAASEHFTNVALGPGSHAPWTLGLAMPAAGVSAAAPQLQNDKVLVGLPGPFRPAGAVGPKGRGGRWQALLDAIVSTPAAARDEALSHGAMPPSLKIWRMPELVATLTLPLPTHQAADDISMRVRPRQRAPERPIAIAVVAQSNEAAAAPQAIVPTVPGTQEAHVNAAQGNATGQSTTALSGSMTSLRAPVAPTALALGLSVPRAAIGAKMLSRKDKDAQQLAQQRAATKRRFAAFARSRQVSETEEASPLHIDTAKDNKSR